MKPGTRLKMFFMHFRMRYYLNATYLCLLNKSLWVLGSRKRGTHSRFRVPVFWERRANPGSRFSGTGTHSRFRVPVFWERRTNPGTGFSGMESETDNPNPITVIFYPYNQQLCRRNIKTFKRASCTQKFTK
jgi:hypothetical protein